MRGHRLAGQALVLGGVALAQGHRLIEGHTGGDVRQRIVRRGLVGDDIGHDVHADQPGKEIARVADHADRERLLALFGGQGQFERFLQVADNAVDVAHPQAALGHARVCLDDKGNALVHGDGQWLRAAHLAQPGSQHQPAL